MSASYKLYEKIINNIVTNNTSTTDDKEKLSFIIYYKSPKTKQLIMRNNLNKKAKLNIPPMLFINLIVQTKTVCFEVL